MLGKLLDIYMHASPEMDQVDANALMVAAILFPLELRASLEFAHFPENCIPLYSITMILEMKFANALPFYTLVCLRPDVKTDVPNR